MSLCWHWAHHQLKQWKPSLHGSYLSETQQSKIACERCGIRSTSLMSLSCLGDRHLDDRRHLGVGNASTDRFFTSFSTHLHNNAIFVSGTLTGGIGLPSSLFQTSNLITAKSAESFDGIHGLSSSNLTTCLKFEYRKF
ncbi:hypothetical protein ElyMa_005983600 [Elysia marginata]|uniref:Uncharacterized protein n=1 Tax=Elysia marginata TaxID=1093978 RepID=A0AAV4GDL7_9GAST|nr:hypothetical protein ElyMa_005983600 [Elysia marginata]